MDFPPLFEGVLERRYQRFLADVLLSTGERVVAHCPNTGAMTGLAEPGSRVWLSASNNPARKLRWTWELVETPRGIACIHSALANRVIGEELHDGRIAALAGDWQIKPEVRLRGSARVDFVLTRPDQRLIIEVKAVTLAMDQGLGLFPDTVSERARKHAHALAASVSSDTRAVLLYCVFHSAIERVAPAAMIDPDYAASVRRAVAAGVEVIACGCEISPAGIQMTRMLPVEGLD